MGPGSALPATRCHVITSRARSNREARKSSAMWSSRIDSSMPNPWNCSGPTNATGMLIHW